MEGIALVGILAIMGGAIAYIGDKLGTRVGKRKLTIFGLRPKYTSILVTIVTGILIASCTLGILMMAAQDVRTALFGMEELKAELSGLSQEVATKSAELESSRAALEAKTAEYSALTAKIKETSAQLTAITKELAEVSQERDRTAAALVKIQSDFQLAKTDLDKAEKEIRTLQTTRDELDARVTKLTEAKTALEEDVETLSVQTANLKKSVQIVREGAIIFRAGEVLLTATIPGGESTADTGQALAGVIYRANQLILSKLSIADKSMDVLWVARQDFDKAVDVLTNNPQDVIVRISSSGNTVYGEPVIGNIELYPNHLLYRQGDIITHDVVKITDSRQAEEAVITFLQKVNAAAVKDGVLPDPIQGTVGSMTGAQLYETINKVKRYDGNIELIAVAREDIYTVGPLKIQIQVKGL